MMLHGAMVLVCTLLLSVAVLADSGYYATYKLVIGLLTVGKMERSFEINVDGRYRFESKLRTTGLASIIRSDVLFESSSGTYRSGTYYPTDYTYRRKNKHKIRHITMHFDRENASIETNVNGKIILSPLSNNLLDKLIYQAALMVDLSMGKLNVGYRIADRGKEKLYQPTIAGEAFIETKIGRFKTIKIVRQRTKDQRRTIFWCAPDLGYLPIKVEYREKNGKTTTALLTQYRRLGEDSP